jgi:hypothetical protein
MVNRDRQAVEGELQIQDCKLRDDDLILRLENAGTQGYG